MARFSYQGVVLRRVVVESIICDIVLLLPFLPLLLPDIGLGFHRDIDLSKRIQIILAVGLIDKGTAAPDRSSRSSLVFLLPILRPPCKRRRRAIDLPPLNRTPVLIEPLLLILPLREQAIISILISPSPQIIIRRLRPLPHGILLHISLISVSLICPPPPILKKQPPLTTPILNVPLHHPTPTPARSAGPIPTDLSSKQRDARLRRRRPRRAIRPLEEIQNTRVAVPFLFLGEGDFLPASTTAEVGRGF